MDRATKTKIEQYTYDITIGSGEVDPEIAQSTPDVTAYLGLEDRLRRAMTDEERRFFKKCYSEQLMSLAHP